MVLGLDMDKRVMTAAWFRTFAVTAFVLLLVWYLLPLAFSPQEPRARVLLGMSGYNAILPPNLISIISFALILAQLVGLVGLWMLKLWGRWLLLLGVIGTVASSPFVGFAVVPPSGVLVGFLSTLLEGALLALAFIERDLLRH